MQYIKFIEHVNLLPTIVIVVGASFVLIWRRRCRHFTRALESILVP